MIQHLKKRSIERLGSKISKRTEKQILALIRKKKIEPIQIGYDNREIYLIKLDNKPMRIVYSPETDTLVTIMFLNDKVAKVVTQNRKHKF